MKILRDSQGLALFTVLFVMTVFLLFVTGGLFLAQINLKIASNHQLATQAVEVADAGLQHGLAVIPWAWDFDPLLNCSTPPCTLVSKTDFPSGSGFSYTVTAQNDLTDINNGGSPTNDTNNILVLNSTASGPNGTKKLVEAYVKRSLVSFTPPGALYLPANSATITFDSGTGFFITGNDTDFNGSPAPTPKPAITGMAPIYDAIRDKFKTALGSSRYNLAQGEGYNGSTSPVTPSVITTDKVYDVNKIALNFYNHPNAVKYLQGLVYSSSQCPSTNPCKLGTDASPQITYVKEGTNHIHFDAYVTGSGVLVVEGKAHIYGNFTFHGLVVSVQAGTSSLTFGFVDDPEPLSLKGNATIFGGVLVGPTNGAQRFAMTQNAKIYYSSQGLSLANNLCGTCLPQPARVFAWLDK